MSVRLLMAGILAVSSAGLLHAEPPHASYIFPAGGQRGTTVHVKVGGHFLHEKAAFELLGPGVTAPSELVRGETVWFEGPLIKQPASQASEDYPQDYTGQIAIAADAPLGNRWWRCWNAQGVTSVLPFVVGELPEVVEQETDGDPIPVSVTLPVTINGRVFPREDVDVWTFEAQAGQSFTCAVTAREIGSPLVARLGVYDPAGNLVAESTGTGNSEAALRFAAPAGGRYEVHITDSAARGLQHYVYRLTVTAGPWVDHIYPLGGRSGTTAKLETIGQGIAGSILESPVPALEPGIHRLSFTADSGNTNAIRFDVADLPEELEAEPNDTAAQHKLVAMPVIVNGRIQCAGDADTWAVQLAKGQPVRMESRVTQLGSPLAMVMVLRDADGKELAKADATATPTGDPAITFTPSADGEYLLEVRERFASRGGPAFAYRIHIAPPKADFQLYAPDSVAVDVGTQKNVDVQIERQGEWKTPLTLHVEGLPAGVTCDDVQVAPNANKATLVFKAAAGTPVVSAPLRITGKGEADGKTIEKVALLAGNKDRFARGEAVPVRLAVTLATPFTFVGQYSFQFAPRGGVLHKRFQIERGGYVGPIEVRLADRQGRHLQGVTGPTIVVPPEASEFAYPLHLPPWMELGRTSRSNLMLTGELQDAAGVRHKVCYTTNQQNEQMIGLVTGAPLRIALQRGSYSIVPGKELAFPVAIKRDATIASPVKLELIVPRHMRGIAAEPVAVDSGTGEAILAVRFGEQAGPFNMPLMIRATGERGGDPIVAEAEIELVEAEN